jgi:putative ABC transport system permease protein
MLRKSPGFTAVAVLSLALGIGANTAIFSVVNAVLLRPLPFPESEQLVMLWETNPKLMRVFGSDRMPAAAPTLREWQTQNSVFDGMAGFQDQTFDLVGTDEPEVVLGARVTASLFSVLAVNAAHGRTFLPEEDQPGRDDVVVMSHALWQRRFGGDTGMLGQTIVLDGASYTLVGIMPPGFRFPGGIGLGRRLRMGPRTHLWKPMAFTPGEANSGGRNFYVVARQKRDVSLEQARAEMSTIAEGLQQQDSRLKDWGVMVVPLHEEMTGSLRPALLILFGAAGFVLLITCVNVANLQLARATARYREVAIRQALGAGRLRVVAQLLIESILVGLLGGALGILLANWGLGFFVAFGPSDMPRIHEIDIDGYVLGFALLISLLTGVLFGLAPALHVSDPKLNESLKEGGRTATQGFRRHRVHGLLVVSEVALSLVVLTGAGLLMRSFVQLMKVNTGLQPEGVLTLQVSVPHFKFRTPQQRSAVLQEILPRIETLPAVDSVGAISFLPVTGDANLTRTVPEGSPLIPEEKWPSIEMRRATPGYFRAIGVPLLKGRLFTDYDSSEAPPVVIVNDSLARRFWPNEEPIGKRIKQSGSRKAPWVTVVGVVADVRQASLDREARLQVYYPYAQMGFRRPWTTFVVRTAADPMLQVTAVKSRIWSFDGDLPIYNVRTMNQVVSDSVAPRRFQMLLLGFFAAVALILAAVGIYGVISYSVSERLHEIGIRMALGAGRGDVLRLVLKRGLVLVLAGVSAGLVGAFALTRLLASQLYGIAATDPVTFIGVSAFLVAVALLATFIPARRATKVDPMVALRHE